MASFEKRAGHWRAVVRRNGERRSATFTTKAAAVAWAAEQENEIIHVKRGGVPKRTLRQAFEKYRAEESPKKRGQRWEEIRLDAFIGRPDKPNKPGLFADVLSVPLTDLTTTNLAEWRDARCKQVKASTVDREMNLLSAVLETARREWKWLHENPMRDVRRPAPTPARKRRIAPDEERRILLALAYDDRPVSQKRQQVAVAWLLAIETAMRQGEILGLTWENIRGKVAHLPKTKNGEARDVPLSSRAQQLLKKVEGLDEARCFTVSSGSADSLFRKAKAAAGVVGLTFHDSRREGTSRLSKKVDVLTLARITGHKDINELMTYYQTDMESVADQLD